jgi:succinate dehydrogenase / fumarate reductase, cytochrome b subunit
LFNYKFHIGTIAWLFHRISGLALIFYLSLHVWVVHYLAESPQTFDTLMNFLASPLFKFAEVGLLAAIIYHSLNGVRVILSEYKWGNANQKALFYFAFGITLLVTAIGGFILVKDIPLVQQFIKL